MEVDKDKKKPKSIADLSTRQKAKILRQEMHSNKAIDKQLRQDRIELEKEITLLLLGSFLLFQNFVIFFRGTFEIVVINVSSNFLPNLLFLFVLAIRPLLSVPCYLCYSNISIHRFWWSWKVNSAQTTAPVTHVGICKSWEILLH